MTEATVDLSRINANYHLLSLRYPTYCVLKSDAYGHGILPVLHSLFSVGARRFAVTDSCDALQLLRARRGIEVLLLQMPPRAALDSLIASGATFALSDYASAEELSRRAAALSMRARCQIAFNTGMNRLGFSLSPDDETTTLHAVAHILSMPALSVTGVYSHLAFSPAASEAKRAEKRFLSAVSYLTRHRAGEAPLSMHLYASGGAGRTLPALPYTQPCLRVGLSLYGYGAAGVLPAMALYTRVLGSFTLRKGERVGYGGTYRAARDTYTAVLSSGYADGLPRIHKGMTFYAEDGRPLSVIGRVSMNHTVVRDTGDKRLQREDRVMVFGMDGATLPSLAESGARIPYEMLLMGSRAVRTYTE